jgi:hypothetical protein
LPQKSKNNSNRKSIILSRSSKRKKTRERSDKLNNKFQILF